MENDEMQATGGASGVYTSVSEDGERIFNAAGSTFRKSCKGRVLPVFLQQEHAECGRACVAMIAAYFGHEIDLHTLRLRFPTTKGGLNLLELRSLCWQLQLNAQALRVELCDLTHLSTPCILHWNLDHFVVLKKVQRQHVWIHDPAIGERRCSLDEVSRCFTGVVLAIEPSSDFKALRLSKKLRLRHFFQTVEGVKRAGVLMLILAVFLELGQMLPVFLMQYVTDTVIGMQDLSNLYTLLTGIALFSSLFVLISYVKGRVMLRLSTQFKAQFCVSAMRHLMLLPLAFFQQRLQGQIQLSFQAMDEIQKKISTELLEVFLELLVLILNGTVMLFYSIGLSFIVYFFSMLWVGIRYFNYYTLKSHRQRTLHQHGKVMSYFLETLQVILPLKASSKELARWSQWRHLYTQALNADYQVSKLQLLYQTWSQLLQQGEYVLLIGFGAYLIHLHLLSLGMLVAFLSYRLAFVNKAAGLVMRLFDYQLLSVELERVQDVLCHPVEHPEENYKSLDNTKGALKVREMCFRYTDSGRYLLNKVNLEVNAGEKLAIIGPSGCGKTTLLKVMMGLLQPIEGEIALDNIQLREIGLSHYRQQIGSVMQDDRLLSGSILENIVFFDEKVDLSWVEEVCQLTALDQVIVSLPLGYGTRLGEQGHLLSGGQKQRLLLARALYKRPKILFLDEATSHLDVMLEKRVNEALKQLLITQIIVAHRQETIAMADRIYELGK
jgi:ATP-binding cassette, subfamily B, bacterial CvaB/MchF/RaxB